MTKNKYAATIGYRMKDYFVRQITAFEQMAVDLTVLDGDLDEDQIEALAILQERHTRDTKAFAAEFRALLREWQTARDISPADRTEVSAYARRVEKLAAQIDARCAQGTAMVKKRMTALKQTLDEVAQGQELLDRYRPTRQDPPSMLDRKI